MIAKRFFHLVTRHFVVDDPRIDAPIELIVKMSEDKENQGSSPSPNTGVPSTSDYESDMSTYFIIDLMKQKREKIMRLKKDELINEMARKQREKMAQARSSSHGVTDGTGFAGVFGVMNSSKKYDWREQKRARDAAKAKAQEH